MMKISFRTFVAAASCLFLVACGMQPYKLPDNEPTAQLNLTASNNAWICSNGKPHSLTPDSSGHVAIPAGQRVVIGSSFHAQGYNVQYSCAPRVNFVPRSGEAYYQDFQIEAEKCYALIYRETPTNPAGVDFEPSMRGGGSCETVFWPEPFAPQPKVMAPRLTFPAPAVATTPPPAIKATPSPFKAAPVVSANTAPAVLPPQATASENASSQPTAVALAPQTPVAASAVATTATISPELAAAPREASPKMSTACGDDISTITGALRSNSERKLLRVDCQLYPEPTNTSKDGALLSAGNTIELVRSTTNADGVWWYVKATGAVGWILVRH